MEWTDIHDIAIALYESDPDFDPYSINFVDLKKRVMELDGFTGAETRCGEKILEAIQQAWLEERD